MQFLPLSSFTLTATNNTEAITTTLAKDFGTSGYISIDKQLKPLLVKGYENITSFNSSQMQLISESVLYCGNQYLI